jgi:hypothetical protein
MIARKLDFSWPAIQIVISNVTVNVTVTRAITPNVAATAYRSFRSSSAIVIFVYLNIASLTQEPIIRISLGNVDPYHNRPLEKWRT